MTGAPSPAAGKRRRKESDLGSWLLVLGLAGAATFWLAHSGVDARRFWSLDFAWHKIGGPVLRSTLFIAGGLLAGQLVESLGWTRRLGRLAGPLVAWARLPQAAALSFTAAFISGVLANTLLFTAYQENRLDKKGMVLANLMNASIPAYVLHIPTTAFILLSLTGPAGLWYLGLTFSAAVIRLVGVAVVGRFWMPPCPQCTFDESPGRRPWREVWAETWPKFRDRLRRVVVVIIPVYTLVVLVAEAGFFTWLKNLTTHALTGGMVPVEAMSVVVFSLAAEFTSGFAAAGALLQSGALGAKEVVLALLVGNVVATPIRVLRHQWPHYMGVFSPALGTQLLFMGQFTRVISILLAGGVYFVAA